MYTAENVLDAAFEGQLNSLGVVNQGVSTGVHGGAVSSIGRRESMLIRFTHGL